jgi:lipopolysaccharide export system permease protein
LKTFDRYISATFAAGFLLVLALLVSLFSIVELVGQLDDVGKGFYQVKDALLYTVLTVPERIEDLMPVCGLLGGIIALGILADRNELLAMQASGLSALRIGWPVVGTVLVLAVAAGLVGEFVAPPLEQRARTLRSRALAEPGILLTKHGFWARRGNAFIHVGKALSGGHAAELDIYESDGQGRLRGFSHARAAKIQDENEWLLTDVDQRILSGDEITTRHVPSMTLHSFLSTEQVGILELPPDSLSTTDLYEYIDVLRKRGQNADRYALALWQKLTMPLTTGAMVLLSLPFVFGPPRVRTAGFRITTGLIVGIMFYLANQITGHMGVLLDLHPSLTTLVPVAAILCVALVLMRRAA